MGEFGGSGPAFPSDPAIVVTQFVTFLAPFILPGLDEPHPPGKFELRETRHHLDVSWEAYRVSFSIVLVNGGTVQMLDVGRSDLDRALAEDAIR